MLVGNERRGDYVRKQCLKKVEMKGTQGMAGAAELGSVREHLQLPPD